MFKLCVLNKEQIAFCRMGLHSSCCRRICIPQNACDKYRNKKLHKDCQTSRHYLCLRRVSKMQIRWNLGRHREKAALFSWLYTLYTPSQASVRSPAWTVSAEVKGARSDWLCLPWCSPCLWPCVADTPCIWDCTDSVLHVLRGFTSLTEAQH